MKGYALADRGNTFFFQKKNTQNGNAYRKNGQTGGKNGNAFDKKVNAFGKKVMPLSILGVP